MIKKIIVLFFPTLFGCSYTFEHKEFSDCVAESGGMKFRASAHSTYSEKGGITYYGEPYEIRIRIGSRNLIGVENIAVVLTDSGGEYSRSYQGALRKVSQSTGYYAWYVIPDEYLPYKDISIAASASASASGEEMVVEFECKLRTDYKRYEKSYLETVWGGV